VRLDSLLLSDELFKCFPRSPNSLAVRIESGLKYPAIASRSEVHWRLADLILEMAEGSTDSAESMQFLDNLRFLDFERLPIRKLRDIVSVAFGNPAKIPVSLRTFQTVIDCLASLSERIGSVTAQLSADIREVAVEESNAVLQQFLSAEDDLTPRL
jgi:hypothetical protein